MERSGLDARNPETREPIAHLAGRLIGERDREEGLGPERAGRDLIRETSGDGGGLPRARSGEDADGAGRGLDGLLLAWVQPLEDRGVLAVPPAILRGYPDGSLSGFLHPG